MDRIEQLMKDAKPRVGAPGASARKRLCPLDRLFHGSERCPSGRAHSGTTHMPCGPPPRPYWPPQPSSARWLSAAI